ENNYSWAGVSPARPGNYVWLTAFPPNPYGEAACRSRSSVHPRRRRIRRRSNSRDRELAAMNFNHEISERLPKLKRYARYLTRNETEAEDLIQDCVERAISRQELFKPGTNLDAWLITIMRNIFINGKRSE